MDTLIPVYPVPALRKAVRSCGALFYACPAADAPIRIQQDFLFPYEWIPGYGTTGSEDCSL